VPLFPAEAGLDGGLWLLRAWSVGPVGMCWLYAVMACSGMVPSVPIRKPLSAAHCLASDVSACQRVAVISARGWWARAMRMASGPRGAGQGADIDCYSWPSFRVVRRFSTRS
jgi:hypothetical protein